KYFPDMQVTLGGGHNVGVPASGYTGGLAAQRHGRHRHADLKADKVPPLVQGEIAAAGIGMCVVFFEAIFDVVGFGFHRDPDAHAYVVGDAPAVGLERRNDLDHALAFEYAALGHRSSHIGNVFDTGGRIKQAVGGD